MPKRASLTHANLGAGAEAGRELSMRAPDSVVVATLPLFHVFGINAIMNVTVRARPADAGARFDPAKVLEVIERDHVSVFGAVPTMYTALLHHPDRARRGVSSLKPSVSGGAPLPVKVPRGFGETFGCKVLEGYGLSETTGMASFDLPEYEPKPGSIGVPVGSTEMVGGTEMKVVDDQDNEVPRGEPGEIVVLGPFVMSG